MDGALRRPVAFGGLRRRVGPDCGWHDPVRYCLGAIAGRIAPGDGTIILDDCNDYQGCRTATDEFLRERDDFLRDEGRNLILTRRG